MAAQNPTPATGAIGSQSLIPFAPNSVGQPAQTYLNLASGTFTATGSPVVVANTNITANSVIIFTPKTTGGTIASPYVSSITPGTGFTVTTGGSDSSIWSYVIIG